MQVNHTPIDSTRGPALHYPCDMRSPKLLLPLFLLLADSARCKDDTPEGGEFAEACGDDSPCADGLECFIADCNGGQCNGYCEEKCSVDSDCRVIAGHQRECDANVCHILCDDQMASCPQDLSTPLQCVTVWCAAAGGG